MEKQMSYPPDSGSLDRVMIWDESIATPGELIDVAILAGMTRDEIDELIFLESCARSFVDQPYLSSIVQLTRAQIARLEELRAKLTDL